MSLVFQWEDKESGQLYNLNRYYDPDSGQYLSQDPIGLEGGLRTHGYVHYPMQWVDPLGLVLQSVDFSGSPDLYPVSGNQKNIVKITMQGTRDRDFTQAYKKAGINKADAKNYTWHHANDFDPKTGKTTMQLVKTDVHEATYPHKGSASQFSKHFGVKYDTSEAVKAADGKGWLKNPIPNKC